MQEAWKDRHRKKSDFMHARNGDHLLVPYECPTCVFRKLRGASPNSRSHSDTLLMDCIKRAILDAFWSRSSSTVTGYARQTRKMLDFSETVGLQGPFWHTELTPWRDHCGYEVAVLMLLYSRRQGKNVKENMQFDTVRNFRTVYGNFVRASPQASLEPWSLGDNSGRYQRMNKDECGSLWFSRFIEGMKSRMGQTWLPNKAFSIDLLKELLRQVDLRISTNARDFFERHRWTVFKAYATVTYVVSLRGPEGFLLDLKGLNDHWTDLDRNYVVIALLGRVKGETQDRAHLLPSVKVTSSGLNVKECLRGLLTVKATCGLKDGPAISDEKGRMYRTKELDDMLHEVLIELFEEKRLLFPPDITSVEHVRKFYQCFRSFRRASDTRAIEQKVDSPAIDIVNRWRLVEAAAGKRPAFTMQQHYAQIDLLLKPFLRYTRAM